MALIKETMTDFGISASYWKVTRISIDTVNREVSFSLFLYTDKNNQSRELDIYTFASATLDDFEDSYNNYFRNDHGEKYKDIYTACYEYCKDNIEFFKDAISDEIIPKGGE